MTTARIDMTDYTLLTTNELKLLLKARQAAVETDIAAERRRHRAAMVALNERLNRDGAEIAKELRQREMLDEAARSAKPRSRYRRFESTHAE